MADDEIDLIWIGMSVIRPENLHSISAIKDLRETAGLSLLSAKRTIEYVMMGGAPAKSLGTAQIMRGDFHGFARRMEEYGFAVEALDV